MICWRARRLAGWGPDLICSSTTSSSSRRNASLFRISDTRLRSCIWRTSSFTSAGLRISLTYSGSSGSKQYKNQNFIIDISPFFYFFKPLNLWIIFPFFIPLTNYLRKPQIVQSRLRKYYVIIMNIPWNFKKSFCFRNIKVSSSFITYSELTAF